MKKRPSDKQLAAAGFKPYIKTAPTWMKVMEKPFKVDTLEGDNISGKTGDYLCVGEKGEMWPLDKEIFESTYKPMTQKITENHLRG